MKLSAISRSVAGCLLMTRKVNAACICFGDCDAKVPGCFCIGGSCSSAATPPEVPTVDICALSDEEEAYVNWSSPSTVGEWKYENASNTVTQTTRTTPTFFCSNFNILEKEINATVVAPVQAVDGFFGFALGFGSTEYVLVDWRHGTNTVAALEGCVTGQVTSNRGLAASVVEGQPNANEFFSHLDLFCPSNAGLVDELARGVSLGSLDWTPGASYAFSLVYTSSQLKVYVNDALEIDISRNSFPDGRFCFYNFDINDGFFKGVETRAANCSRV